MSGNDSNPYTSPQPNYTYSFYGITGQRLATLNCNGSNYPAYPVCSITGQNVYFGGKLIVSGGVNVVTDRLGTVRANGQGESFAYYPYGEERTSTVDKRDKFATYFRDSVGQDYADQRYYDGGLGRFWTVDPGGIFTADPGDPTSWNRYAYVGGDPVNYHDPTGLWRQIPVPDPYTVPPPPSRYNGNNGSNGLTFHSGPYIDPDDPDPSDSPLSGRVQSALLSLRRNLGSDCLGWLETGIAGNSLGVFNQYFNQLIGSDGTPLAGAADFDGTQYQGASGATNAPDLPFYITINTQGAFFKAGVGVGYVSSQYTAQMNSVQSGTTAAQYFILVHELAHYFKAEGFDQDDRSIDAQKHNNDLIWKKCGSTIKGPVQ